MFKHIYDFAVKNNLSNDNRYRPKYIKKHIVLTIDGEFIGIEDNDDKIKVLCPQYPERVTYGNTPNFIVEKGIVIFDPNNKKHENYLKDICEAAGYSRECQAVYTLLTNNSFIDTVEGLDFNQSQDLFSFKIGTTYIEDSLSWRSYFEKRYFDFMAEDAIKQKSKSMISTVTGNLISPVKNADKVSVGGITTGTGDVIVCCDKPSFQSYGLEGALNGALSKEESETIKNGLDYLLRNNYHRDWNLVHWYDKEINTGTDIINTLFNPYGSFLGDIFDNEDGDMTGDEKDILLYEYLQSLIRDGKLAQDFSQLKDAKYFLFNYKPCGGRIAFSHFRIGDFNEMFENILLFYKDSAIQKSYFIKENDRYLRKISVSPIFNIKSIFLNCLNSKVENNKKFEQVEKEFGIHKKQALLNTVICGDQIPFDFVQRAVLNIKNNMNKGEKTPTVLYQLLKVYINREKRKKGEADSIMETVNLKNDDVAYNLGRLFCVYEKIQEAALGNVNASITDKFYSAASTAPAYVFGRLANTANYHLKKIENKGLEIYYKTMLGEIAAKINVFPQTLSIVEQGNFSLGYYQQEQYMYSKKNHSVELEQEVGYEK